MVFRAYFFALPFASFLGAALFFPTVRSGRSWLVTCAGIVVSFGLLASLTVAYYGKDRMYRFTPNEVEAAQWLAEEAPAGSLWLSGTLNWPIQSRHYEYFHYDSLSLMAESEEGRELLEADPTGVVMEIMEDPGYQYAYFIITSTQKAETRMIGSLPAGTLERVEEELRRTPGYTVVFENKDAVIIRAPSQWDREEVRPK